MPWDVEYTNEFGEWWESLDEAVQISVDVVVGLLIERGVHLDYPYSSGVEGSRIRHLRELRIQHKGEPLRILYAFDLRRVAILLIGGVKTGDDRWYDTFIPLAERLYDKHLEELEKEGKG